MRLLTLLLVTRAAAEWVEISQHHYRKPVRNHNPFTTPKAISTEEATKPWSYNNRSVTEHNWNKSPSRTPSIGNIKRVQHANTVRTTERILLQDEDFNVGTSDNRHHYHPTEAPPELKVKQKGTIERVPNIGNVKRVQLNETPVKSHPIRLKGDGGKVTTNDMKGQFIGDPRKTESKPKGEGNQETFIRRIYVNKLKKDHIIGRPATLPPENEDEFVADEVNDFKRMYRNYTSTHLLAPKPTFITESEDFNKYDMHDERLFITPDRHVTEKTLFYTTESIEDFSFDAPKTTTPKKTTPESFQNFDITTSPETSFENKVYSGNNVNYEPPLGQNHEKTKQPENPSEDNNSKVKEALKNKASNSTKTEKNKVNTIENVLKFMTVVADTISKNSRRSFGGKVSYLQDLKDSILANIEDRIEETWPDEDSAGARRHSRSAHASPRGHVHIPSSESALMTISFLTFAVFLIKLVLQVIHTYKNKAMMVAPLVVAAAGRNIFTRSGHH
ncbi:unnamed protein product [Chrysodeixis includens]|uniref:Uncharacterized protein n=1 Tax=Chrysodeixis includens TaxID=689277 RepID=A0A9N8Q2D2_CHRIL|nr:unnamed protein product [Chrysodeixis includens]